MTTPLKFFNSRAIKRICFDGGFVEPNAPMFVAKWNDLLVIAKDADNYFVATSAQTAEYVEIIKNGEGEVEYCTDAPTILPQGPRFVWTVQCGRTCQDGCDETLLFDQTVNTKEEVDALLESLDGVRFRGPRDFIRVRGPGYYQIKRPKRVTATAPAPQRAAPVSAAPERNTNERVRLNPNALVVGGGMPTGELNYWHSTPVSTESYSSYSEVYDTSRAYLWNEWSDSTIEERPNPVRDSAEFQERIREIFGLTQNNNRVSANMSVANSTPRRSANMDPNPYYNSPTEDPPAQAPSPTRRGSPPPRRGPRR